MKCTTLPLPHILTSLYVGSCLLLLVLHPASAGKPYPALCVPWARLHVCCPHLNLNCTTFTMEQAILRYKTHGQAWKSTEKERMENDGIRSGEMHGNAWRHTSLSLISQYKTCRNRLRNCQERIQTKPHCSIHKVLRWSPPSRIAADSKRCFLLLGFLFSTGTKKLPNCIGFIQLSKNNFKSQM